MSVAAATPSTRPSHLLIRASAGTGKTFQLSNRYLELIRQGVAIDQVLATTFTRKAAGEILDRVLQRLAAAGLEEDGQRQLAEALNDPSLDRSRCLNLLIALTGNLHRMRVSTLDSFFAQVARAFSFELALPPGWTIVDELDDSRMRDDAIDVVLQRQEQQDLLTLVHLLTKGEAVRGVTPLVRSTINDLYGVFLETDRDAWHALPHYPRLTAEQLQAALDSLAAVELKAKSLLNARKSDCERAAAGDWKKFLTTGLAAKVASGVEVFRGQTVPPDAVVIYRQLLDHARAELVGKVTMQTEATWELLSHFHSEYQRLKNERRGMRFEDITRRLAAPQAAADPRRGEAESGRPAEGSNPEPDHRDGSLERSLATDPDQLAFRLDAPLNHLLLDEFQDTSPDQWRVMRPFAHQVTSRPQGSFFCVGDAKQAIYGWRGGVAEIFDTVVDELPDVATEALNRSYRSAPAIMDAVNRVFANLNNHDNLGRAEQAVIGWAGRFPSHETNRRQLPGYACLLSCEQADGKPAERQAALDEAVELIEQAIQRTPEATIGVLVRTNESVGHMINRLRSARIPASQEGGNPLTDSAAVQLLLSLLRLCDHPGDRIAAYHLFHSPLAEYLGLQEVVWNAERGTRNAEQAGGDRVARSSGCGAGEEDEAASSGPQQTQREREQEHQQDEQQQPDSSADSSDARTRRYVPTWSAARRARRQLIGEGYGPAIAEWAEQLVPFCSDRELGRLEQFIEMAYEYQDRATLRTSDFIALVERQRVSEPAAAKVRVMTIHQAKGLEFDIVILPELNGDLIGQPGAFVARRDGPTGRIDRVCRYTNAAVQELLPPEFQQMFTDAADRAVTESMCVLYVAMTRAVHCLYMIVPPAAETESKLPRTFAGLLRTALTDGKPVPRRTVLAEVGDPGWHERAGWPAEDRSAMDSEPRWIPPPRRDQRSRGLEAASPSSFEGGGRVRVEDLFDQRRGGAMQRGTVIHAWFEQIEWLEFGVPDDPTLRQVAEEALVREPDRMLDVDQALVDFREMLERPTVAAALGRERLLELTGRGWSDAVNRQLAGRVNRLVVRNERRFALRQDDSVLSGSIDRLVLLYDDERLLAAEVIDFKTDAVEPTDAPRLAEKVAHYRPQLDAYRSALSELLGLPPERISSGLLFVQPGHLDWL